MKTKNKYGLITPKLPTPLFLLLTGGFFLINAAFMPYGKVKFKSSNNLADEIGLIIYGRINTPDLNLRDIELRLFEENDLVLNFMVNRKGEFELPLYINEKYILEVNAPGYFTKRFYFDTSLPQKVTKLFSFGFEIELIREEMFAGAETFSLDFPFALVRYNPDTYTFNFCEEYSLGMKLEEKNAIDFSQKNRIN